MDGDGCISIYSVQQKGRKKSIFICEIKFIGTYDMLNGIKMFFNSEKRVLINKHSPKCCQISFYGTKYSNIVDSLYENATIYLSRKRDKWIEFKKYIDEAREKMQNILTRKIVKLDKNAIYIGTYNLKDLKEDFDIKIISKCCEEKNHKSHKNFLWLFLDEYDEFLKQGADIKTKLGCKEKINEKKGKPIKKVEQYDLNGQLINTWDSVNLVAEYYNTTSKAIRKVCTGERKTCCNYVWRYIGEIENRKNRLVFQYNLDGKLVKQWNDLREAAVFYEVTFQAIERAINGKYNTCCGFIWCY